MAVEPVMLAGVTGVFGALGMLRVRRMRPSFRQGLLDLSEVYLRGRAEISREREHRVTLVAAATLLPPGGCILDQRADGATLMISGISQPDHRHSPPYVSP